MFELKFTMKFPFPFNNAILKAASTFDLVHMFQPVYCKYTIATSKILSISAKNSIRLYDVISTLIARFNEVYLYLVFSFTYPLTAEFIFFAVLLYNHR